MMAHSRWERCVRHHGDQARGFMQSLFTQAHRRVMLIGGAGFDPRSPVVPEMLGPIVGDRIRGLFLREERPRPNSRQETAARDNIHRIQAVVPASTIASVRVFATGSMAITGGREAVRALQGASVESATDIVLDLSALSIGVAFPVTRHLLEELDAARAPVNLHLVVVDHPAIDGAIRTIASDSVEVMPGFKGGLGLDANANAAKLWVPQLALGQLAILSRIRTAVGPDGVAPILPFPASTPRAGDELIEEYAEQFESEWQVQAGDIVYASESRPLDLYRSLLHIGDKRRRVFEQMGGSLIVLSPIGGKVAAIGAMLAAIERDFPIVYVEATGFTSDASALAKAASSPGGLVHLWLRGETESCPLILESA